MNIIRILSFVAGFRIGRWLNGTVFEKPPTYPGVTFKESARGWKLEKLERRS